MLSRSLRPRWIDVPALVWVALIALATLRPWSKVVTTATPSIDWATFLRPYSSSDVLANIALFAVLGLALGLRKTPFQRGVFFGILFSILIEFAQVWIPTRNPNPWDVLANGAGTAIGLGFLSIFPDWHSPTGRLADRLTLFFATGSILTVVFAGVILKPTTIHDDVRHIQAPPLFDNGTRWGESFEWVRLNGTHLTKRPKPEAPFIWNALSSDFLVEIRGRAPAHVDAARHIVLLSGHDIRTVGFWLISQGDDLLVSTHNLGQELFFDRAVLRARGFSRRLKAGEMFEVRVSRRAGRVCLRLNQDEDCALAPSAAESWRPYAPGFDRWLGHSLAATVLWLTALILPVGFYVRRNPLSFVAVASLATVFAGVHLWTPLQPMSIPQATLALLIFVCGIALSRFTHSRSQNHALALDLTSQSQGVD